MTREPRAARVKLTRRTLLFGGVGLAGAAAATAAGIETGVIPGRNTMYKVFGLNGQSGSVPTNKPGPAASGTFASAFRPGSTAWQVSYPPGYSADARLPVLISLHGVHGSHTSSFGTHFGLDHFLAAGVNAGMAPFAIAAIDGGDSYWHARRSGEDSASMVVAEFLPLLAERGLLTDRIGLFGWSMGGFGALDMARTLGPERVAVVIAESPAMWPNASRAAVGAFDDAADFAAHTPLGHQAALAGIPVRVDCGTGDGFYPMARDYVAGFDTPPAGSFEPGGHNHDYWRRMAPAQLAYAAAHLGG